MKRVLPTVSVSTTMVILTRPTFHCIRCFLFDVVGREDAGFGGLAQWIVWHDGTLSRHHQRERAMPELGISTEKVGFLIEKARQFDVKEEVSDPDSGSNAADDDMIDVLQDNGQDPVLREITGFISALSEDERVDLVALMRLGRGDATIDEWEDLRNEAAGQRDRHTARYLLGEPMLGDLLAQGLDEFGLTWDEERTTADSSSVSQREEDERNPR
jgi:hypothetical protein